MVFQYAYPFMYICLCTDILKSRTIYCLLNYVQMQPPNLILQLAPAQNVNRKKLPNWTLYSI